MDRFEEEEMKKKGQSKTLVNTCLIIFPNL